MRPLFLCHFHSILFSFRFFRPHTEKQVFWEDNPTTLFIHPHVTDSRSGS